MESVHRDDRPDLTTAIKASINGISSLDVIHRIVRPRGLIRHVHVRGEMRNTSDGSQVLSGTVQDVSDQMAAEARIRELAYFDPLTGLPNRRFIVDRLEKIVSLRERMAYSGGVIFIDLDNFKTLNDTYGHDKGDLLLKEVANRIRSCVRHCDSVGRFGGDEFVVLIECIGDDVMDEGAHAHTIAEKILAALNEPYDLDGLPYRLTPSIGIALFDGDTPTTGDLLKRADMAMYKSKAEGRNTIRFFSDELQRVVTARAELESDIRNAVLHKEFHLDLQLQENAAGKVSGVEILLRWHSQKRGMVPPTQFIPLAEETGLIMPIGAWVLEEACKIVKRWSELPYLRDLVVSVNVSVRQFHHPDFVAQVCNALSQCGADPSKLKLEITESMLISDYQDTNKKMIALKSLGIRFALDDFGTGCSSLSHLQRLPIDQLKIDQSFVQHVISDKNDAAITRSIISLAKSLGLAVIAEGVETEAQQRFLWEEGCMEFQGFLYHLPLSTDDIESHLTRVNG
jgi:diguanylate cyclase (GGDEF)-like protein